MGFQIKIISISTLNYIKKQQQKTLTA